MPINKKYVPIDNQPTIKPRTVTGLFTKYIPKVIPLAFDESMSYYECLCALLDYINKNVIPALDNNAEGLEELQEFYVELQSYVNNYFDNLDVQEEINNKLDGLVDDGTLEQIIEQFINSSAIWGFDTVADMKTATNLINGSYARTLGYYSKNDGGGSLYKIRTITNDDVVDESTIISLYNNLLIGELINPSNVNQFGAYGDGIHDDTTSIQNAINYFSQYSKENLHLLHGTYLISTLAIHNNISIIGCGIKSILKSIDNNSNDLLTIKDSGFNYITLKSFKIDGNKTNSNSTNGILIDKTDVPENDRKDSHVTIKDITIIDVKGNGIYNSTGGRGNIIDNCIIKSCDGHGILFGASDSIIINTNCMWNKFTGIWVRGSAHRIVNSKCYCNGYNNSSENRQDICGLLITGINTQVDSCECQENYGDGIVLANNSNQLINVKVDRNGQKVITWEGETPTYPGDSGLVYSGIRVDRYYRNAPVHYCTIIGTATDHGRATNTQLQKTGIEIEDLQDSTIILNSENQVVDISYGNGWSINLAGNNTGAKNNVILNGRLLGNEFSNGLSLISTELNNGTKKDGTLTFQNLNNVNQSIYKVFSDINDMLHLTLYDKNGTWKSNLVNSNITDGEGAIGFFNRPPQKQMTAPAIPTDLQSCIGAIASLIQILNQFGFTKSSD